MQVYAIDLKDLLTSYIVNDYITFSKFSLKLRKHVERFLQIKFYRLISFIAILVMFR